MKKEVLKMEKLTKITCLECFEKYYIPSVKIPTDAEGNEAFPSECPFCKVGLYAILLDEQR